MNRILVLVSLPAMLLATQASAVPDCNGVLALNAAGKKVVRITCRDDQAPGTAQTYQCSWKWDVRTKDGVVHPLKGSFSVTRGEPKTVKYEDSRVDGQDIDDETDGISVSCAANP